jgi:TrmH family RNA methyltransferase
MQIISQNKSKQIRSLHQKKFRESSGLFLVEGAKTVLELLASDWQVEQLVATEDFISANSRSLADFQSITSFCNKEQLTSLSTFHTNQDVLDVARKKPFSLEPDAKQKFWLVLESLSDPGNLGTIIRLADWFGLHEIILAGETVDWYNPKVISSSMGSFLRIRCVNQSEKQLLDFKRPVFAAHMEGTNLYDFDFPGQFAFVIGNEARGLSETMLNSIKQKISIPAFGSAESLNAAMASGIILNQWQFQNFKKVKIE